MSLLNDWDFKHRKRSGDFKYFLVIGYIFITAIFGVFQQGQLVVWLHDAIVWSNGKPEFGRSR